MYENSRQKLLTRSQFLRRVAGHVALAIIAVIVALGIGVCGYHYLNDLPWVDALVNASMILGGMGPLDPLHTNAAKVFASVYALFSGLVFIALLGVLLAPFIHRLMHRLHISEEDEKKKQ
jgi:predicted membrane-bound spermidine synthase